MYQVRSLSLYLSILHTRTLQGSPKKAVDYFSSIGFSCPLHSNPGIHTHTYSLTHLLSYTFTCGHKYVHNSFSLLLSLSLSHTHLFSLFLTLSLSLSFSLSLSLFVAEYFLGVIVRERYGVRERGEGEGEGEEEREDREKRRERVNTKKMIEEFKLSEMYVRVENEGGEGER